MLTLKAEVYILHVSRCTKKVVLIVFVVGIMLILKTVFLFEIRAESRVKICIKVTCIMITGGEDGWHYIPDLKYINPVTDPYSCGDPCPHMCRRQ